MKTCSKCLKEREETDFYMNGKKRHVHCKSCHRAKVAARYEALRKEQKCFDCKSTVPKGTSLCPTCTERRRDWYHSRYHSKQLAYSKKRRVDLKLAAFNAYGGPVCKCCGESHIEFLSIDHLNNDGAAHRRELKNSGVKFYEWLKRNNYPVGYQVLCFNCNFAKGHFKYCPHQQEVGLLSA